MKANDRITKADVLADFKILTEEHYEGDIPPSVHELLAKLVGRGLSSVNLKSYSIEDEGYVYILGDIDEDMGNEVVGIMDEVHGTLPIEIPLTLLISTDGAEIASGLAIIGAINRLRRDGRKVHGHVSGLAFSFGFDILQRCDRRTAESTASLMFHQDQYEADGNTEQHKIAAAASDKQCKVLAETVAERTGKPLKYYIDKIKGIDWYLTAPEALAEGLIDEIIYAPKLPKSNLPEVPKPKRTRKTNGVIPVAMVAEPG